MCVCVCVCVCVHIYIYVTYVIYIVNIYYPTRRWGSIRRLHPLKRGEGGGGVNVRRSLRVEKRRRRRIDGSSNAPYAPKTHIWAAHIWAAHMWHCSVYWKRRACSCHYSAMRQYLYVCTSILALLVQTLSNYYGPVTHIWLCSLQHTSAYVSMRQYTPAHLHSGGLLALQYH
jgi:hypothetical protein